MAKLTLRPVVYKGVEGLKEEPIVNNDNYKKIILETEEIIQRQKEQNTIAYQKASSYLAN